MRSPLQFGLGLGLGLAVAALAVFGAGRPRSSGPPDAPMPDVDHEPRREPWATDSELAIRRSLAAAHLDVTIEVVRCGGANCRVELRWQTLDRALAEAAATTAVVSIPCRQTLRLPDRSAVGSGPVTATMFYLCAIGS